MRRLLAALILGATSLGAGANVPAGQQVELKPSEQQGEAAVWVSRFLTRLHYSARPLDDAMSQAIFTAYLDSLDGDRWFLTQADVEGFARYRKQLDDAIEQQDLSPAFTIYRTYLKRVSERTAHARALLDKGFDFAVDEDFNYNRQNVTWAGDTSELDELWRKRVKNDWLRLKLAGRDDAAIRKTLDRRYKDYQQRVNELDGEDVFRTFLNAYTTAIEPHTNYMSPRDSENFAMQMRLSLEGIGAVLQKVEDYVVVRSLVKGGPADMTGLVKPGDRIVAVGQGETADAKDAKPPVDVVGWRTDNVVDLIRGKRDTWVRIEFLPADAGTDGKTQTVAIKRDRVKLEQQAAKSQVIEVEEQGRTFKVGVIDLPAFYSDFAAKARGDANARSSTRDVRELIVKLKQDGVEALVMDLRSNGGGALTEATELTGLFIDEGPVVQVRNGQGRIEVEADTDPGTVWDGPLVVMVSRASASATEIFAGAIQDYGRGLIVGETTFGKGTVQNLVDLDQMANSTEARFGQLKMTIAQYFRVSGSSTQHRGVVPDIRFPQTLSPEEYGESSFDNALPYASIRPASYTKLGRPGDLVPILTARFEQRSQQDREFQLLTEELAEMETLRSSKTVSLLYTERKAERDRQEARRKERQKLLAALTGKDDADADQLDDGLDASERLPDPEDEENREPDVLMRQASRIAADLAAFSDPQMATAMREAHQGKPAPLR